MGIYLRNTAGAKAKAEAELGQGSKPKSKNKPKSKQVPKLGPNPLILVMNDKIDFGKTRMMRDTTIKEMFAKHDLKFDLEWKQLKKIDISEWFENVNMDMDNALDYMDNLNVDSDMDNRMSINLNVLR